MTAISEGAMSEQALAQELSGLELFEGCTDDDLAGVTSAITGVRRLAEGEVLCSEGEVADRWWIVLEGQADATTRGLYVATIGPGETIGEMALLDGQPRTATVTATTDMVLHEVDGSGFVSALLTAPNLAVALLREFASRLRTANERPAASPRTTVAVASRPAASRPAEAAVAVAAPAELDPGADGYFIDPYAHLGLLREQAPVHWSESLQSYVITRYDDVRRLSRERSLWGSVATQDPVATLAGRPSDAARRRKMDKSMIRRDGDDHLRLRRLLSKVFTPRAISAWRDTTEAVVDRLLTEAADHEKVDVMTEFAKPVPVEIISRMLGMPRADLAQLGAWSQTLTMGIDPLLTPEEDEAIAAAGRAMFGYVDGVIADKRDHPGDDIISHLIQAEEEGERLEDNEIQAQVVLLYIAGHETTANLIGNTLTHLFEFPEQLDLLRSADPGLDSNAVEEALRFDSPAHYSRRANSEPVEVGGTTIPAGSLITLALASANRDGRKWGPTADVLDLARPGANEHVSFGGGPHFCLGNALARLEGQIALPKLVRRFPRMEPAYSEPSWNRRMTLRGVSTLPVVLR